MNRLTTFLLLLFPSLFPPLLSAAPPNILLIIADDCTYNDLRVYGGENAKTPHIDELASRGLVFDHAYVTSAMCQPCRAELYTGLYPMRNGCAWNHAACKPGTRSLPHHLKPFGYRVGLTGKTHLRPPAVFPFENVPGFDPSCVRNPTRPHDPEGIDAFINTDGPFCLVVALVEPHIPWVMGDASQYPPKKIKLPPQLADTPSTREYFGRYLAEITYMDQQVGDILDRLDASGKADDTLVLFTSEQGSQFPGCKWTNWNTGLHTGLIVVWPGVVAPGTRTPALVQYTDVVPTLLDLATAESKPKPAVPKFDGTSFARVLRGETDTHRDFAFGMHNNVPEGPPYPIRSITDGTHRYIRNLRPDELYIEKHLMGDGKLNNPYFQTWFGVNPDRTDVYERLKRYMLRPAEELYHTIADPFELDNLAEEKSLAAKKIELSNRLDRWLSEQNDPGIQLDSLESLGAARKLKHRF